MWKTNPEVSGAAPLFVLTEGGRNAVARLDHAHALSAQLQPRMLPVRCPHHRSALPSLVHRFFFGVSPSSTGMRCCTAARVNSGRSSS